MRHRWWLPVVATCAALVSASSPTSLLTSLPAWAQGGSQGSWSIRAPYRAAVNEVAVVAVGRQAPCARRQRARRRRALSRRVRPGDRQVVARARCCREGSITSAPRWLTARSTPSAALSARCTATRRTPCTNMIRRATPGAFCSGMKAGRGSVGVAVIDGKVHAIGGRNADGQTVATHEAYDPATNSWKRARAAAEGARSRRRRARPKAEFMSIGGRFGPSTDRPICTTSTIRRATPGRAAPPMPTARSGLAGTLYKDLFMVLGGELPPTHVLAERSLRSQDQELARARADAGGSPRALAQQPSMATLYLVGRLAAARIGAASPTR